MKCKSTIKIIKIEKTVDNKKKKKKNTIGTQ